MSFSAGQRTSEKLAWAYYTLEDKLTFGMPEEQAVVCRERRVKQVLKEAMREVAALERGIEIFNQALDESNTREEILQGKVAELRSKLALKRDVDV